MSIEVACGVCGSRPNFMKIAPLMQVIKSIIVREVFKRFPGIKRFLCGGAEPLLA